MPPKMKYNNNAWQKGSKNIFFAKSIPIFNLCDIKQEAFLKNKIQYLKRRDKLPLVKTLYGEDSTVEGSDTG
jgi:hypothetical protein